MTDTVQKLERAVFGDDDHEGIKGQLIRIDSHMRILIFIASVATAAIIGYVALNLAKTGMGAPVQQQQSISVSPDGTEHATEYTTKELAAKFGYSEREIQDRAANGEIPGARKDGKAWRFNRAAADAALPALAAKAAPAAPAVKTENAAP